MSFKQKLWLWGPVAFYAAFIFWLSSAPRPIPGIQYFPWIDKVFHLLEYAPLGILLVRAVSQSHRKKISRKMYLGVFIAAVIIGGLDEFYQRFTPMRVSSLSDAFADAVGAFIGQFLYGRTILSS